MGFAPEMEPPVRTFQAGWEVELGVTFRIQISKLSHHHHTGTCEVTSQAAVKAMEQI